MQDNDPKHTSRAAKEFFMANNINWWRTPAESPDMNPIENLWHELKEFIRREVKPRNKEQLVEGIIQFWATIDTRHMQVLPIYQPPQKSFAQSNRERCHGDATGY